VLTAKLCLIYAFLDRMLFLTVSYDPFGDREMASPAVSMERLPEAEASIVFTGRPAVTSPAAAGTAVAILLKNR
jgi:hypothetical protein